MHPERNTRMITSRYEEALDRIKWIETGLEQLIKRYPNDMELGGRIRTFVRALLDGEPTTTDVYNNDDEILEYEREHICRHGIHMSKKCVKCDEFSIVFTENETRK